MKKKIVVLIPARAGSKGIKNKNKVVCAGKPLISWTLQAACASPTVSKVYVSTDDKEIMRISRRFKVGCIVRPKSLAADTTAMIKVVRHASMHLDCLSIPWDAVMLLQPTSPLRTVNDIEKSIRIFLAGKAETLVSACEDKPFWTFTADRPGDLKPLLGWKFFRTRCRQDLPKAFRTNGAIYIVSRGHLARSPELIDKDTSVYVMPAHRSVDVDSSLDLGFAEYLLSKRHKGKLISRQE